MATTKKTAAKTTAATKTPAKKTAAKKTAAKKAPAAKKTTATKRTTAVKQTTVAAQTTATKTTNAVRESITTAAKEADETIKQYAAVAGDQLVELRQLAREVVDIYVGIPFVLGTRFADSATAPSVDVDALKSLLEDVRTRLAEVPSVDFDAVKSFIDEAKAVGHDRVTAFEIQAAVAADSVSKRVAQLRKLYAA